MCLLGRGSHRGVGHPLGELRRAVGAVGQGGQQPAEVGIGDGGGDHVKDAGDKDGVLSGVGGEVGQHLCFSLLGLEFFAVIQLGGVAALGEEVGFQLGGGIDELKESEGQLNFLLRRGGGDPPLAEAGGSGYAYLAGEEGGAHVRAVEAVAPVGGVGLGKVGAHPGAVGDY